MRSFIKPAWAVVAGLKRILHKIISGMTLKVMTLMSSPVLYTIRGLLSKTVLRGGVEITLEIVFVKSIASTSSWFLEGGYKSSFLLVLLQPDLL